MTKARSCGYVPWIAETFAEVMLSGNAVRPVAVAPSGARRTMQFPPDITV
jgi:hypothetical protein